MSPKTYYLVSGVVKFDYKSAGYKDLLQIANEWAEEECFKQIIIRFVSENNLGIQFLYIDESSEQVERGHKDEAFPYIRQLKEKYGA